MARFDAARIRAYYDRNTPAFVAFGQGGDVGAIHRAVWGPGVADRGQAFRYVEDRIVEIARRLPAPPQALHVVDLGCGVASSLCYLATHLPIRGTGITLSPGQAAIGQQRIAQQGLADRVACIVGDYGQLPPDLAPADLAFAIESFVHGPDPARFFAECGRIVRPGGALVICDDVLRPSVPSAGPSAAAAIGRFRRGWHINTLLTADGLRAMAAAAGFALESAVDLSPWLELDRPRDRIIGALAGPLEWLPWRWLRMDPLLGGSALQRCLARGWIGYELAVFRRM